ncbi:hypothetical protein [[Clostridium] fimetarium]|uniref:Uncharacterized protein n=1 Tax=[Clostridium] fimetarium TaxID=99656 RepID=A0A1I0RQC3_9FIRM|nr:hypothetical protein [[Clostridium] fimetarium]SEW43465.1 hypothetical protein SAMN05421659_1216 [[Clostridium] fimetarium]
MKYLRHKKYVFIGAIIMLLISLPISAYCFNYQSNDGQKDLKDLVKLQNKEYDLVVENGIEKIESVNHELNTESTKAEYVEDNITTNYELETAFNNVRSNEIISGTNNEILVDLNDSNVGNNDIQVIENQDQKETVIETVIEKENDILLNEQLQAKKEAAIKSLLEKQKAYKEAQLKMKEEMEAELEKHMNK